jgi:hypothetical protein
MDNIQNCDSYTNIPSSQTYRCYSTSVPSKSKLYDIGSEPMQNFSELYEHEFLGPTKNKFRYYIPYSIFLAHRHTLVWKYRVVQFTNSQYHYVADGRYG